MADIENLTEGTATIRINAEPPKPATFEDLGYVQVVRCKDCKWFNSYEHSEFCKKIFHEDIVYECNNQRLSDQEDISTRGPDWFCADGERK